MLSYIDALNSEFNPFITLKELELKRDSEGMLYRYSGSRAVVLRGKLKGKEFGVKLFTAIDGSIARRVELLNKLNFSFAPKYQLLDNEIEVVEGDKLAKYPVLLSEWVEGTSLDRAITSLSLLGDKESLCSLRDRVIDMFIELLESEVVHGDIKPENIVVSSCGSKLTLIDWDGFYHNEISDCISNEVGSDGYRRSYRGVEHYGTRVDDYPIALIVMNLVALSYNPFLMGYMDDIDDVYHLFSPKGRYTSKVQSVWRLLPRHRELIKFVLSDNHYMPSLCDMLKAIRGRVECSSDKFQMVDSEGRYLRVIENCSGLYGYLCSDSNRVFIDTIFGGATPFYGDIAAVKINNKWFFIDITMTRISDYYDSVIAMSSGVFKVRKEPNDKYFEVSNRENLMFNE